MNNPNRLWIAGTAVVVAIVIALGGFLGVAPQFTAIATADADREAVEAQNLALEGEIAALKTQTEQLEDLRTSLETLGAVVPRELELPSFTSDLTNLAVASTSTVKDYTVVSAVYYTPPEPATIDEGEATTTATTDPTAGGLITPLNFVAVKVTFTTVSPTMAEVVGLTSGLQTMPRLFAITDLLIDRNDAGQYETMYTGYIFVLIDPSAAIVLPDAADPAAEPTPTETPAPTETPVAEATPTPTPTP